MTGPITQPFQDQGEFFRFMLIVAGHYDGNFMSLLLPVSESASDSGPYSHVLLVADHKGSRIFCFEFGPVAGTVINDHDLIHFSGRLNFFDDATDLPLFVVSGQNAKCTGLVNCQDTSLLICPAFPELSVSQSG